MNAIRNLIHTIRFIWCSIPATTKLAMGRWYVFRDEPDWLVFQWAVLDLDQVTDELMREGVRQATEETTRRLNRLMDGAIAKLNALLAEHPENP